jgi:hypothetical protein
MGYQTVTTPWQKKPDDVILLVNQSSNNYILELPTGRVRLDAGRTIRTLRSIMKLDPVKALVEEGELVIE